MRIFLCFLFVMAFGLQVFAHPSWGIAVDKDRNIYFADLTHNGNGTVWKLTPQGKLIALFKDFHCHKLMLDKDQNLLAEYVGKGDREMFLIRAYPDGKIDTLVRTTSRKEFSTSCDVALNGTIYFSTDYVWSRDPFGRVRKHSNHKLYQTQTLYVDELENVYVPDKGVDNGVVIKFDRKGRVRIMATDLISKLKRPKDPHNDVLLGITKGCDGNMYVAENAGQRIIKILDNQQTETFYKSEDQWYPTGIDFFAGDAYILEYNAGGETEGPRITKIDEFGNQSVLFHYGYYKKTILSGGQKKTGKKGGFWIYMLIPLVGMALMWNFIRRKYFFR